jgi:hypothetical protein
MVSQMSRIDLNVARSHIGQKVNLHLKDGSVIVNVIVTKAGHTIYGFEPNRSFLHFAPTTRGKISKIPLKEIDWMEPLSSFHAS